MAWTNIRVTGCKVGRPDCVADLPESGWPGAMGIRLLRRHTQRNQAGPQQLGDVADPAAVVAALPCASVEHVASGLRPTLEPVCSRAYLRPADEPTPQRFGFVPSPPWPRMSRPAATTASGGRPRSPP
jgi:hypothetical protein